MTEKLNYYDILAVLVPGTLLMCWVPICFPAISTTFSGTGFPDAFVVITLIASAIFVGQLIQTIGSLVEPLLFWSWKGRPSDRALHQGLGQYLPKDTAVRIREKLTSIAGPDSTEHSLFLVAMQRAESANFGRAAQFNGLYAYHRAFLVLMFLAFLLLLGAVLWGVAAAWSTVQVIVVLAAALLLLIMFWHRTRQRAFYYVREVLLIAEKVLDEKKQSKG